MVSDTVTFVISDHTLRADIYLIIFTKVFSFFLWMSETEFINEALFIFIATLTIFDPRGRAAIGM
jgi:hypothetical protein